MLPRQSRRVIWPQLVWMELAGVIATIAGALSNAWRMKIAQTAASADAQISAFASSGPACFGSSFEKPDAGLSRPQLNSAALGDTIQPTCATLAPIEITPPM